MANLIDKFMGAVRGLAADVNSKMNDNQGLFQQGKFTPIKVAQQSISNFATQPQNQKKVQVLQTWEPLVKTISNPIQTVKSSLAKQNIKTPKQFVSTVVKGTGQKLDALKKEAIKQYVYNPEAPASQRYFPQGFISKSQRGPKITLEDIVGGKISYEQMRSIAQNNNDLGIMAGLMMGGAKTVEPKPLASNIIYGTSTSKKIIPELSGESINPNIGSELAPLAEKAKNMSENKFIQLFDEGLKSKNLTVKETAQNALNLIKQSGMTVKDFYNQVKQTTSGAAQQSIISPVSQPQIEGGVVGTQKSKITQIDPIGGSNSPINFTPLNPKDPFYNIERMNIPAQEKQNIIEMFTKLKPEIERVVGTTLSNEQVKEAAKFISDDLIKLVGIDKTEELAASQLSLAQKIAGLSADYSPEGTKQLANAIIRDKAFGEHIARILQARGINVDPLNPQDNLRKLYLSKILSVVEDEQKVIDAASKMTETDWNNPQKTAEFYREFVKPTAGEFIDKLRYSSMLSSPNTHLINIASNLEGTGILLPIQKTIEGAIDSFFNPLSIAGNKIAPNLIKVHPKTRFAGEGLAYTKAYYSKEAGQQAKDLFLRIMKGAKEGNYPDIKRDTVMFPKPGVLHNVEKSFDFILNSLYGEDGYFSIRTQAGLKAALKYKASKGVDVSNLEKAIPDESKRALFNSPIYVKGEGIISEAIGSGGKWVMGISHVKSPVFRWLGKMSIPFIKIGTNLLKVGLEANPVTGTVNLIGNKDKIAGLAKILMGSAVMALAAVGLSKKKIKMHAWYPSDATKRKAQQQANILPWSMEITLPNGKVESVQFSKMHPLVAFQLASVAAVDQAWRENILSSENGTALLDAVTGMMKFVADQSYFKNLGDMTNLMQGDLTTLPSLISNYPSQFVPFRAFQGWFTRIIDTYQRSPEEGAGLLKQVIQNIQSGIPMLSDKLPQKLDSYGRPIENPQRIFNSFSPVRVAPISSKDAEIFDLYMQNSLLNEAIKKSDSINTNIQPGVVSNKAVDEKMSAKRNDLLEKQAKSEVTLYHEPRVINGKYIYWNEDTGTVSTIDSNVDPKKLAGLSETSKNILKRSAEYKYADKLINEKLDPNFVKNELGRLNISQDKAIYDIKTGLTSDIKLEEIKSGIAGLSGEELFTTLASYRVISEGTRSSLLTDSLITDLKSEGIIDANTATALKNITWDLKTSKFKIALGTGKVNIPKITVPGFKSVSNKKITIPKIKLPDLKSSGTSSAYTKIATKIPKTKTKTYNSKANYIKVKFRKPVTRIKNLGSVA